MKSKTSTQYIGVAFVAAAFSCPLSTIAQPVPGIPEPGLVLYGQVRNLAGGGNIRLTYGTLRWTVQPQGGAPITVTVLITNINDQFSYVARVPFETVLAGFTLSPNTLQLTAGNTTYNRSATVDGVLATIVSPATASFTFSAVDRGRMERVDLNVSMQLPDSDGDGLPDSWETHYFGNLSRNGLGDLDGDGFKDLSEYRAGTDPRNNQSLFEIIEIKPDPQGGISVRWSSVTDRRYTLERSGNLQSPWQTLQANIPATPTINAFRDSGAIGAGPYFYRLRVQ